MTPAAKAAKEKEILTWMHKEGYDRRASSAIAPIIVKYLDEVVKNNFIQSDVNEKICDYPWHYDVKYLKINTCEKCGMDDYD